MTETDRFAIARRYADDSTLSKFFPDEFKWWEIDTACRRCTLPLHIQSGQDAPFCPNCAADNANAKRGRIVLMQARQRQQENRTTEIKDKTIDEEGGRNMCGMPL